MFSFILGLQPTNRKNAASGAPTITGAGTISPASGPVGTVFTLTAPTATGAPAPTVTLTALTQNGISVLGAVVGAQFTATTTGPLVATWTASNGTAPDATSTANAAITPSITVTAFGVDRGIYDSHAAFAANLAAVPLKGTGTVGEVVQARAVSLDDGGATTTAWADLLTISAGGNWAAAINVPRSSS